MKGDRIAVSVTSEENPAHEEEENVLSLNWHLFSIKELEDALETSEIKHYLLKDNPRSSQGLSDGEAARRLERDGKNVLTGQREPSPFIQYLKKYLDPLMIVLNICAVCSFVIYALQPSVIVNLYLGVAVVVVVVISATLSYVQEGRSRAVMAQFVKLMSRKCTVLRQGRESVIDASELVSGDIVFLKAGDAVPADVRLFFVNEMKVENSALTGESLPVSCQELADDEKTPLFESSNIAWSSTNVVEGEGFGVVFACGNESRIGTISSLTDKTGRVESTLQKEIKRFVYVLTIFAMAQAIIFYIIALARKKDPLQSFVYCFIVIMIANVPEGLPTTVMSLLTIIAKRLAENNVNVKRLQNVETLGSCTVIASDKTGTITQNKMSVSQVWVDLQCITAEYAKSEMPASTMVNTLAEHVKMPVAAEEHLSSLDVLQGIRYHSSPNAVAATAPASSPAPIGEEGNKSKEKERQPSSSGSEAVFKLVRTFANLELVATLCNRARFEDERQLGDKEATELMGMQNAPVGRSRKYEKQGLGLMNKIKEDSKREIIGDASDKALFRFISSRQSIELLRYQYRVILEVPFSSAKKYALVVVAPLGSNKRFLLMKGAPEVVLERCKFYQLHGVSHAVNSEFLQAFDVAYASFARDGERVLGFAMMEIVDSFDEANEKSVDNYTTEKATGDDMKKDLPDKELNVADLAVTGYTFLGVISLVDPPKPKVARAVEEVRSAGVKVVMVTGDHPLTAVAIANQVGIMKHPLRSAMALEMGCKEEDVDEQHVLSVVVTGRELLKFNDEDWKRVLSKEEIVFARTTPEQKLAIVEHLQAMGHIVAVTGDGVNDAPALKKADIGVAMGINGSDVARGAGTIILMDDDFSSIVVGIREGRLLFDNIMNTIAYTLTHLWPEVMPTLLNIALDLPLAMGSLPVLGIDCGTELAPAISLAYEKAEDDVMRRKPRDSKKDRLVTLRLMSYSYAQCGVVEFLVAWLGFMLVFHRNNVPAKDLLWSAPYWTSTSDDFHLSNGVILTADEQVAILGQAQILYWFLVVLGQVFHVFFVRTRTQTIFKHGLFNNMVLNYGVLVEISLIIIECFVPVVHDTVMGFNYNIYKPLWALFLLVWACLFVLIESTKWIARNKKPLFLYKVVGY